MFRTNKDAPNYRLIQIDFHQPEPSNWKTLIEQSETDVLDWATCVAQDKLIVCYIKDVKVNHESPLFENQHLSNIFCSKTERLAIAGFAYW